MCSHNRTQGDFDLGQDEGRRKNQWLVAVSDLIMVILSEPLGYQSHTHPTTLL